MLKKHMPNVLLPTVILMLDRDLPMNSIFLNSPKKASQSLVMCSG